MPAACFRKKKPPTFVGGLCSRYLSSWVGQVSSLRLKHACGMFSQEKISYFRRRFVFALSIFQVGQRIILPQASVWGTLAGSKNPQPFGWGFLCSRYLFSQAVTRQVSSTHMSLTSVFGMGTGGPSSQSTRTMWMAFNHLLYISKALSF